ncbi:MAG: C39 family peptidase [Candidatus Aenigmatarchaeota archaeon]
MKLNRFLISLIIILVLLSAVFNSANIKGQKIKKINVPYIHQRYDTPIEFVGAFSCAPTSAVMILAYYGILEPDPIVLYDPSRHSSPYGKYVSREYTYSGKTFDEQKTIHDVCDKTATGKGAWGYIWQDATDKIAEGIKSNLLKYLEEHDMRTSFVVSPSRSEAKEIIKKEIDDGRPLIARNYLTESGHYVVVVGYEVDSNGNFWYIVNDPNGRRYHYKKKGNKCWGCYVEEDPKRKNPECLQPVKYSYDELRLGDQSRGLILIEPINIDYPKNRLKIPETIKLYLTDEDRIVKVDFKEYCKNVLPNEWIGSWDIQSLRTGAMAVKTYGWYRKKVDKYPNEEFDVKDSTADQDYEPNSNFWKTDQAIEETWEYVMTRRGEIFQAQYINGSKNSAKVRPEYEGRLSQYGSQYLATEKDMDWRQILHHYYDPVEINKISMNENNEELDKEETVSKNRPKTGQSICNLCGEGLFNFCDRDECNSLGACWFEGSNIFGLKFFPNCFSCDFGDNKIDTCGDYISRESCEKDPCYISECMWADKYIAEEPHCVNNDVYSEYRDLKSKLNNIHLAFHPECGDNSKLAYKIGEEVKKKLDFYLNKFKMRDKVKCEYKSNSDIPKSFPCWPSGSKNTHMTISLIGNGDENKVKYYKNDEHGKQLSFDLFKNFKKAGYKVSLTAIGCPGTPEICENLYNTSAVSIEMDFSTIDGTRFSEILMKSLAN